MTVIVIRTYPKSLPPTMVSILDEYILDESWKTHLLCPQYKDYNIQNISLHLPLFAMPEH